MRDKKLLSLVSLIPKDFQRPPKTPKGPQIKAEKTLKDAPESPGRPMDAQRRPGTPSDAQWRPGMPRDAQGHSEIPRNVQIVQMPWDAYKVMTSNIV